MSEKNTEYWDFCKAENSDEEDNISDLQSRLYAEIYYSSDGQDQWNTKNTMKTEHPHSDKGLKSENTIHKACQKDANTSESSDRNACPNVGQIFEVAKDDDNSKIIPLCDTGGNGKSLAEVDDKSKVNTLNAEYSCKISENATNKNSKIGREVATNVEVIPDLHQQCNTSNREFAKHESELENRQDLNPVEPMYPTVGSAKIDKSPLNCNKSVQNNSDKGKKKRQSKEDNGANSHDDILTKYSFSKTFINKLYLQKYQNLNKTLEDGQEDQNLNLDPVESETNSRYHVLEKSKKPTLSAEVTVVSSDSESDSEVSILEVPIPPKPKPPVIHLKDSDEGSSTSSDSDADQEHWCVPNEKDNNTGSNQLPHTKDDIVLNCTEVQKGASSIMEIREMSKNTQLEQRSQTDKNLSKTNKSDTTNEISNTNVNESGEGTSRHIVEDLQQDEIYINEENNSFQPPLFTHQVDESDAIHEKHGLDSSYDFTEDISITNESSSEPRKNRKRHCDNDNDTGCSAKQKKCDNNENVEASTSTAQDRNKKKNKEETWEEYIFRPMSKKLKAFYNSPRGQENFDVGEIQSKMSKDPRLWAILDEDLMPNASKRNRFWNVRCNHCHRNGHQRYNCPEPRKPPQCHMCGTQGHIETRCPEKMCLTCGKKQSTFRKTCEACRLLHCNMCKAVGHKSTECPDLWRRFHQTTQNCELNIPENLNEVMKPADLLYCCNCAKRGHDSSMCHEYRWSPHFPTPAFVSNYVDGSGYDDYLNSTLKEGDFVPLAKRRKIVDTGSCSNVMFLPDKNNDLPNCRTIYSCGSFFTIKNDGQQILKNLTGEKSYRLTGLLAGRVAPTFLEELLKIVPFQVTIFHDAEGQLMLRIRSKKVCKLIVKILVFWFKLEEDEKDCFMSVNLPRKRKGLFEFLKSEWSKLGKSCPDPRYLQKMIQQCKHSLTIPEECPVELHKTKNRMKTLQAKLVRVYNTKPTLSSVAQELKSLINHLGRKGSNTVRPEVLLRTIFCYNQVFMPYTIPKKALEDFYMKYYRAQEKIDKANKQSKQKMNPYEKFKAGLVNYNKSAEGTKQKQIPVHIRYSDNIIQTRSMTSATVNSQVDQNIRKQMSEEHPAIDKDSHDRNITEHNETLSEFSCNQEIPYTCGSVEIHPGTSTVKKISPNLITIPLQEFPSTATASKQTNRNKPDILCIDIENTHQDMGKQSEVINNNEKVPAEQYNSNCDASTSKKKQSNRNSSNITCINVESTSRGIKKQSEIITNREKIAAEQDDSNCDANTSKKKQFNRNKSNILCTAVESTSKNIEKQLETINNHEKVAAEQGSSNYDASTTKKKQFDDSEPTITCVNKESTQKNMKNQTEIKSNHENVSSDQDNSNRDVNPSKKKKKKKKSKKSKTKKESQQDDTEQSEFDNICDLVVINRANEAINDALAFQIPYMNNAAAEVQKRVTDKSIKQEHVDVLRKLVDLEKDHQKHVTSFCSYLK